MVRLQILELPTEHHGDDMVTPYLLVVDQATEATVESLHRDAADADLASRVGARGVLCFEETVDIPVNEVPVDPDGYPLKFRIEPDFETFREQVQEEALYAQGKVTRALRATDQDRKDALTDALGMDPTRGWDDIRDAAAELQQLRAGEEPVTDSRTAPTPAQWIWQWNRTTPEKRLSMAAQILEAMPRANNCFMQDHEARIADLQAEVARHRAETPATEMPGA